MKVLSAVMTTTLELQVLQMLELIVAAYWITMFEKKKETQNEFINLSML